MFQLNTTEIINRIIDAVVFCGFASVGIENLGRYSSWNQN